MNLHRILLPFVALGAATVGFSACNGAASAEDAPLKDTFADKFLIGAALTNGQVAGADSAATALIRRHFNSIVAENCMKCEKIHPYENTYFWDDADRFVAFGEENDMFIIGHCLIWHPQCAPWFFVDDKGEFVDAETLKHRMRDHIHTIVGRYKGRVDGWDVVNEAIMEDGSYRKSPFYTILGEEFIPLAFQYAHEADPDAELYINDYGMNCKGKRERYVQLVNDMHDAGLRVDGIGMQSHMGLDYPDFDEYEQSLEAFASTGCNVMITEWDMSALPTVNRGANIADTVAYQKVLNPYPDGLPDSISAIWNNRMETAMDIFVRHADVITRVTAWGVSDGYSWKNDWPVPGRTEYPLLFDRNNNQKPFLAKYSSDSKQ